MTAQNVLAAIIFMAAIIFATRLLPFLFFTGSRPPQVLNYLEETVPPLIMCLLVLYCLKDVHWLLAPYGLPELAGIAVVVATHLWRGNALLSISAGTILYMALI
jgi:branched-subunit amino acid transport protein AzlD